MIWKWKCKWSGRIITKFVWSLDFLLNAESCHTKLNQGFLLNCQNEKFHKMTFFEKPTFKKSCCFSLLLLLLLLLFERMSSKFICVSEISFLTTCLEFINLSLLTIFLNLIVNWGQFHQHSTSSFYARRSQKFKKTLMTWLSFLRFWDLWA